MGEKLAELSGMTKEQTEKNTKEFIKIGDKLNLKPGVKIPLEEAAKKKKPVNHSCLFSCREKGYSP